MLEWIWNDINFDKESFGLSIDQRKDICKMISKYRKALALEFDEVAKVSDIEMKIDTGENPPIRPPCRPLAPHLKEPLKLQLNRWLRQGVIAPGSGAWASPIIAVLKKTQGWRFCADYRKLNAITRRDCRPVANLNEKIAQTYQILR